MTMNYQLRAKKNNSFVRQIAWAGFFVLIVLLCVRLFFPSVFTVVGGVLFAQDSIISNVRTNFISKNGLQEENVLLRKQIAGLTVANQLSIQTQKAYDDLYRSLAVQADTVVTSEVLLRPPFAAYDSYIIASGESSGVEKNQVVTVGGAYVIGYIDAVTETFARVRLFSSASHEQTVSIDGFLFESVGQGAGTIEARLPRNFAETTGQTVRLPGLSNLVLGTVVATEFDPQDSYVTGVITPGVNMFQTELVTVIEQKWIDVAALDLEQFNNNETDAEDTDAE